MTKHRYAAPGRRNPTGGSSSSSPTAFLPAHVCKCLQRLPAAAERLLSLHDCSSDRAWRAAEVLNEQLNPVLFYLSPTAAEWRGDLGESSSGICKSGAVLADTAVREALLRLVSAGVRLPPEQPESGTRGSAGAPKAVASAVRMTYGPALGIAALLLQGSAETQCSKPPLPVVEFALKLLRMQTLQAFSRQLAAAAADFPGPFAATVAVSMFFSFAAGLVMVAASLLEAHLPVVCTELAAALQDSCVVEHGARLLLAAGQATTRQQLQQSAVILRDGSVKFNAAFHKLVELCLQAETEAARTSAGFPPAAQLVQVISGRCVQHAAVVQGLAVLCEADGGPSYGLPRKLLRRLARVVIEGKSQDEVGPVLEASPILSAMTVLDPSIRASPPGRRAALALLMRIGRLAVASGQAWTAANSAPADSASPAANTPAAAAVRAVIEREGVAKVALRALQVARWNLRPLQPGAAAGLVEEAAEWWRLLGAVAQHVVPLEINAADMNRLTAEVTAMEESMVHRMEDGGLHWPPEPPPGVAAALAGGLLPCLERLLRCAGQDLGGLVAILIGKVLTGTTCLLPLLLVYGEERHAAALVVTVGKLLRAVDPRLYVGVQNIEDMARTNTPRCALHAAEKCLDAWGSMLQAANGAAGGIPSAAAMSAPLQQLALIMSCAACEWLPSIARLTRGALEFAAQQREAGGAIEEALTSRIPLKSLLGWLPTMAMNCMRGEDDDAATAHGESGGDAGGSSDSIAPSTSMSTGPSGESDDGGGWRQLLLEEVGVIPLLELALRQGALTPPQHRRALMGGCCFVAAAFPEHVRQAALAAAADPEAGWRPERLRALMPAAAGSGGGSGGAGEQAAVSANAQGRSVGTGEAMVTELAAQLESWCAAGDSAGEGRIDMERLMQLQSAMRRDARPVVSLVPQMELRRRQLLRTCGNPGCVNLAGDSETELGLKACGRCGAVRYCCRECQTAHWKAGHKEACGSGRGG